MADDLEGPVPGQPGPAEREAERLRLRTSTDTAEITSITLDALVPAYADAVVVYAAEDILRGRGSGLIRTVRPDASGQVMVRRAGTRFADDAQGYIAFPSGGTVAFGPGSPCARCVHDGKAVVFTDPGGWMLDQAGPDGREVLSRFSSYMAVPLDADGTAVGAIALARGPGRPPFGESGADAGEIQRIATSAGTGIASILAAERHQATANAMRRSLLAAEPEPPENLDVSARCVPAEGQLVGGDWFDLVGLPGGRTGIVAGDVMGHGPEAAVIMAQLRSAAHVLAQMDLAPAELLTRLNRLIATLGGAPMATCLYAILDPAMESCTLSAAGHLPPVLARPGHAARVLDLPSGLSLGVGPSDFGQASIRLRPGAVIGFYTDGLVETRHRSYDQGVGALCAALDSAGGGPLDDVRDRIITGLAADPEDDVTLILARIPG